MSLPYDRLKPGGIFFADIFLHLLEIFTGGQIPGLDFKNAVVIMTSNVGSQWIRDLAGDEDAIRERVTEALQAHFRPEFLNRIDEVILFHNLTREHLVEIVDIQVEHLRALLSEPGIDISLSEAAKTKLAADGYDPAYGARPLKRVIQRQVQDPLAVAILEGRFCAGDTVYVEREGDELVFSKKGSENERRQTERSHESVLSDA